MKVIAPSSDYITVFEDSRRWREIELRADDIVISTPPKSGTTWTQGIVTSLLWPAGDAPASWQELSPWVDARRFPIDKVSAWLGNQTHRRFIKTHSPGGTTPFSPSIRYLTVYRHPADALVSWGNHRKALLPEAMERLNANSAVDGLAPLPIRFEGDYDTLFEEWAAYCSPARHLAGWWERRHEPNVAMLHYADLQADLDGEMRRIQAFLDLQVPDELWEDCVERCRIDAMRTTARSDSRYELAFDGGADAFFHKGRNGRSRELLRPDQLERVREHCVALLPDEAVSWLYSGGPVSS